MTTTKVEARNMAGELLTLSLTDLTEGVYIADIDGIDPVRAVLITSSYVRQPGTQYQSSRRGERNLIFKLGYEPNYENNNVSALRRKLYRWFMPETQVKLRFYDDDPHMPPVDIVGRTEDFVSPRFTRDPDATIMITCFNPDFLGLTTVSVAGNTTSGTGTTNKNYEGTVDSGILFKLFPNRDISAFSIFNQIATDAIQQLDFATPLLSGDILEISTVPGAKGAWRLRSGVRTSVLRGVSAQSDWISLYQGLNKFRVYAAGAAIPYTYEYLPRYGAL